MPIFEVSFLTDAYAGDADAHSLNFARLTEETQIELFNLLGQYACVSSSPPQASRDRSECCRCDTDGVIDARATMHNAHEANTLSQTFISLTKQSRSYKSKRARVAAMNMLFRLTRHIDNRDQQDLTTSYFGKFCFQGLRSTVRELRISAG